MSGTRSIAAEPAQAGAADRGRQRSLSLALLVIATAQLMVVLDSTVVNVALPPIQRALGFSGSGLEWVVNAYALAFGGLLLLGGRAGDILGRHRVFIVGVVVFSLASLLGGLATSQDWLLAARGLASSLINTGQVVGGSIGLAILGTVAWTVVVNTARSAAHAASSAHAAGSAQVSISGHALAAGFSRGFEVSAAIMVLALVVAAVMIRVTRRDLAWAQP